MKFKPDFLEILQLKEEAGQVFWFRVRVTRVVFNRVLN